MSSAIAPRSWLQLVLDVVILSYTATFSLAGLSHCAAMWQLRKMFFIALRYVADSSSSTTCILCSDMQMPGEGGGTRTWDFSSERADGTQSRKEGTLPHNGVDAFVSPGLVHSNKKSICTSSGTVRGPAGVDALHGNFVGGAHL